MTRNEAETSFSNPEPIQGVTVSLKVGFWKELTKLLWTIIHGKQTGIMQNKVFLELGRNPDCQNEKETMSTLDCTAIARMHYGMFVNLGHRSYPEMISRNNNPVPCNKRRFYFRLARSWQIKPSYGCRVEKFKANRVVIVKLQKKKLIDLVKWYLQMNS